MVFYTSTLQQQQQQQPSILYLLTALVSKLEIKSFHAEHMIQLHYMMCIYILNY